MPDCKRPSGRDACGKHFPVVLMLAVMGDRRPESTPSTRPSTSLGPSKAVTLQSFWQVLLNQLTVRAWSLLHYRRKAGQEARGARGPAARRSARPALPAPAKAGGQCGPERTAALRPGQSPWTESPPACGAGHGAVTGGWPGRQSHPSNVAGDAAGRKPRLL